MIENRGKKEVEINRLKKRLNSLRNEYNKVQDRLKKGEQRFSKASLKYIEFKKIDTQKVSNLRTVISSWPKKKERLNEESKRAWSLITDQEQRLTKLETQFLEIQEEKKQKKALDDKRIEKAILLNEMLSSAGDVRQDFYETELFTELNLENKDNKEIRSKTLKHSNGKRKIIIRTSHWDQLAQDEAKKVEALIKRFLKHYEYQLKEKMTPEEQFFYELINDLFIKREKLHIGQNFGSFLKQNIPDSFPELQEAQEIAMTSLKHKSSRPYIIILEKKSEIGKWKRKKLY